MKPNQNNVRDYLKKEFPDLRFPEEDDKIGIFSKSENKVYHNGELTSRHRDYLHNLSEDTMKSVTKLVRQMLNSGGFADNH